MIDPSTYSLSDFLMFSPAIYFRQYELYNARVWPAHLAAVAATLFIIGLAHGSGRWRGRTIAALLAASWAFIGWFFFYRQYVDIFLAAPYFAWAYGVQALLLLWFGVAAGRLQPRWNRRSRPGVALFLYAVIVHPLVGPLAGGRDWAGVELFGLAPDPTAIGTLALLSMAEGRLRWVPALLPLLWCAASGLTYHAMERPSGYLIPAAAAVALVLMMHQSLPNRGD